MGWQGRILRVNLTENHCAAEPLNRDWAAGYLGSRGLGTKYLFEEIDPAVDPLDPGNKLIFATGPLTGTAASTGGRFTVVTKGALTGAIAASNSGGKWGAELKFAGYDMIIVEGRARKPVYLLLRDDEAELLPADDLWGTTVWHTETTLQRRHDLQVKVASIGEAGEWGCRFACVVNDMHRAAGRSGVGAVMGSKNLKAIAVRGTKGVPIRDPAVFMAATTAGKQQLAESEGRESFTTYGTNAMTAVVNAFGTLPTRNNRDCQFEGADNIGAEAMMETQPDGHRNLITNGACFACTIGCGRISHVHPEHFSIRDRPEYHIASGGLEYETAYGVGAMVGVDDLDAATFAGFMANEHGMDPISLGASIAAAMELFEEGVITTEETGGIELRFGSAEALCQMAEQIGKGEGFGRDIGLGAARLCAKYGRPEFAMCVKGQEFAGYDGRSMQGMGLAYATSNRGACHVRANPYADDFARKEIEGKPSIVKKSQDFHAVVDSTGICLFTVLSAWEADMLAAQIDAACDGGWTAERLLETGERIWNLERLFNLGAGLGIADDGLPARILDEPLKTGTGKGLVNRLPEMLPEYYELRGWDPEGVPASQTLTRLGLG